MPKLTRNLFVLFLLLLTACTSAVVTTSGTVDMDSLASLQALAKTNTTNRKNDSAATNTVSKFREMALKETALSLGAQAGLAWRAKQIDDALVREGRRLDTIYDFNLLILEHNVLPPVLLEGRRTLNLANTQTIRISDRTYKVAKQAHFVTTPPNWRQYLWMDYQKPDAPHTTILPNNQAEQQLWCVYVEKGWDKGIEQADTIFEENVARIKEDFAGMILYRKLLAMNMVSPPFVSQTELGVTGDSEEIHIDDQVLRITALPALNVNSAEWRAAVSKDTDVLAQFRKMEKRIEKSTITVSSNTWQPMIAPINEIP